MKLTEHHKRILQLLLRHKDHGDGWRICDPILFKNFILSMPDELVEKNIEENRARLTSVALILLEWM